MNKTIVAAVVAFVFGSVSTGVWLARAQPAGPPGGPPPAADGPGMGRWVGPGQGPWAARMHERGEYWMHMRRTFALVNRAEDRKLSPADVQKIAEAFLLWNGNHTWKVLNAKPEGDVIGFDLATAQGEVIAHFTMDPKTAHVTRVS